MKEDYYLQEENDYTAASLSEDLVNEVKSFEDKLGKQVNKDVIVIAYEKEKNETN